MAKSKTSDKIKINNARGSFLRLAKPKAFQEGQTPRFEATFLLDPTNPAHAATIAEIKSQAKKLVEAQWGEKPAGLKLCFGLADNDEAKKKYDGYAGMFYITTANTERPGVYAPNRTPVVEGDAFWPYSGCNVNTVVTLWGQQNKFGNAIRANLRIVQFAGHNQAFGGGAPPRAEEELELLEDKPSTGGAAAATVDDFD